MDNADDQPTPGFDLRNRWRRDYWSEVRTGLESLDLELASLGPGSLVAIVGEPRAGLTTLGLSLAREVAVNQRKSVLVVSGELDEFEITRRMAAQEARVAWYPEGGLSHSKRDALAIVDAVSHLSDSRLLVVEGSLDMGAKIMDRAASLLAYAGGLDLVFLDCLEFTWPDFDPWQALTALKLLAGELRLVVGVSVRSLEPSVCCLTNEIPASRAEEIADTVLLVDRAALHRPYQSTSSVPPRWDNSPRAAEVYVAKHPQAAGSRVRLEFDEQIGLFIDSSAERSAS